MNSISKLDGYIKYIHLEKNKAATTKKSAGQVNNWFFPFLLTFDQPPCTLMMI